MASELWQRIRAARKRKNFTQEKLGELCGVSKSAVAQWESSRTAIRTSPSRENLLKIHEATGASINWLMSGDISAELNNPFTDDVEKESVKKSSAVLDLVVDLDDRKSIDEVRVLLREAPLEIVFQEISRRLAAASNPTQEAVRPLLKEWADDPQNSGKLVDAISFLVDLLG